MKQGLPNLNQIQIVAEVKTQSPFYPIRETALSWQDRLEIASAIGQVVSIHTDPRWCGSLELVSWARELLGTGTPILAKGIHRSDQEVKAALKAGADYVLVVGRVPRWSLLQHCWIEPLSLAQLATIPPGVKVVWNQRDLKDGSRKTETFAQARELRTGWLCQASLIRTVEDVDPKANAILVGEHLPEFARSLFPHRLKKAASL